MKKTVFTLLFCFIAILKSNTSVHAQTLIHYWHFNNFNTAMYTPTITAIPADYSILDTNMATILYAEVPGTSTSYSTYIDPNPAIASDSDTINAQFGEPPGNMLRPRNPTDSMRLLFYIPTTGFQNIVLKYGTESSSVAHGDTYQDFDYSVDSGVTWSTAGLSELQDSAWLWFKLVTVSLTSPTVNNTNKLVFRITFNGNTILTSGNNRFDNVTVTGDSLPPAITTTPGAYGPFCNITTSAITVPYTTVGSFAGAGSFSVQLSNSSGSFASGTTIIGSGSSSPITAAIPAGTTPGTYRIRVINTTLSPAVYGSDNGYNITVNGPPTVYTVSGGGTACAGTPGVYIDLSGSQLGVSYQLYKSGVAVGSVDTGTGAAITLGPVNVAGTYQVKAVFAATTACGSTMSGIATVTVSPSPPAITGTMTVCTGQTVTLHDATTGGAWSSSSTLLATVAPGSGTVGGVAAGTPSISYTVAGCPAIAVVTVNAVAPITGVANICVGSTTSLSDAVTGGTWSSGSTSASIGAVTGVVTGVISGGTSVITYTNPAGCGATTTVSINTSPSAIGGPSAVCAGATTNLTNTTTGGTWVSSNTAIATIGVTGTLSGIDTGHTTVTYTLPGGCAASTSVYVSLSPGPISGPGTVCSATTIPFSDDVSGGLWTSSSSGIASVGSLSGQVTGAATGTAVITYSLGSSCTVTTTITINPSPAAISGAASICSGTTLLLSDFSGSGTWSSANTAVATITTGGTVTGAGTGTSLISYTVAGCPALATVTVNTSPSVISGPAAVCAGLSISLSDAITGGSWSTASTTISVDGTGSVSGLSAGTGTVTYAIGACSVTKTIVVNPVAVITGPTGVCIGATADLTPSVTGGSWAITPTSTATITGSGVVTGAAFGTATITYTLSTGCVSGTIITVNSVPTAITGGLQVCAGSSIPLGDAVAGGTWSIVPTTFARVAVPTIGSITGVSAGTALVTYSLGTGCTVMATVTVNPLPLAVGGTTQVCQGLATMLTDGTTGGYWSIANTVVATIDATGDVSGIAAGTDSVRYTIPTGCMSVAIVTVNPLPGPISVSGYVCLGLNTSFSDLSSSGGTWSSSNTLLATIDVSSGVVTGVGPGAPTITYTLPTGCIATVIVTVNSIAPPVSGTPSVCVGHTTTLGDPLPGGAWSSTDTTIATVSSFGVVSGVSAGVITISYVTAICPAVAAVTVNPIPLPISGSPVVCQGSADTLMDVGGGTWSSSFYAVASADLATGVINGLSAGVAIITYTLDIGCSSTLLITVNPLPMPITGVGEICLGSSLALGELAMGGTWSTIDPAVATISSMGVLSSLSDGEATVSYTIATGCAATRSISVISVPAITGVGNLCAWGDTATAYDSIPGGTWTSTSALVSSAGLVTAEAPGAASVTYTIIPGCSNTATFTVKPGPGPITGNDRLCIGLTTILADTTLGGVWTSGNTALASVPPGSGIVTGVSSGIAAISYTSTATGCSQTVIVTVSPVPTTIVTTSAVVCSGATTMFFDAVPGGLWSSSNTLIATVGASSGTITGADAGTAVITYNLGASCNAFMSVTVNPAPTAFTVTGTGGYCTGSTGRDVGLSESYEGFTYQLYDGATPVGSPYPGTYTNIDFGELPAGDYTVIATDTTTSCTALMTGSAVVIMEALPNPHPVTGGGSYCNGGTGELVGMGATDGDINYQLYDGATIAGGALAGTGGALSFGLKTAAGTYGVIATNIITGCIAHMPDSVTITIIPVVTPAISVSAEGGDVICAGTSVTFSAAITNGGATPAYRWEVNGATETSTDSIYSYTPANGDVVKAILISSAACATPDTVSNTVTMTVDPIETPIVTIAASPGLSIPSGQYDTLTATATNAGSAPVYQWKVNGIVVAGVTTATFISDTFSNGDVITCTVTGSGTCAGQMTSSPVTLVVSTEGVSQVTSAGDNMIIVPNPNKGEFMIKGILNTAATAGSNEEISLEITNLLGQIIYSNKIMANNGFIDQKISLNNTIANGMYILNLRSGGATKAFHIVIEQ